MPSKTRESKPRGRPRKATAETVPSEQDRIRQAIENAEAKIQAQQIDLLPVIEEFPAVEVLGEEAVGKPRDLIYKADGTLNLEAILAKADERMSKQDAPVPNQLLIDGKVFGAEEEDDEQFIYHVSQTPEYTIKDGGNNTDMVAKNKIGWVSA